MIRLLALALAGGALFVAWEVERDLHRAFSGWL